MAQTIQLKRGNKANLPAGGAAGEPLFTLDRGTLHVATGASAKLPVVPAVEDLQELSAVDGAADFLLVHDVSESSGQKEKKLKVSTLRAALNIPVGASDEKVAVVQGGTSGYLFGTNGTDGVLRVDASLQLTKDSSNGFITLSVKAIDGGTF